MSWRLTCSRTPATPLETGAPATGMPRMMTMTGTCLTATAAVTGCSLPTLWACSFFRNPVCKGILTLQAGAPLGAVGPLIGTRTAPVLLFCRTRPRRRFRLRSGRNWPVLDSLLGAAPALGTALLARALAGPRVLNRSRTSLPLPCRGSILTVLFHLNALLRQRRSPMPVPMFPVAGTGQRAQQDNVGQSVSACPP